jgi:hypothetical protein
MIEERPPSADEGDEPAHGGDGLVARAASAIEAATGGTFDGDVLDTPTGSIAVGLTADAGGGLWLDEIETLTPGKHLAEAVLTALRAVVQEERTMLYVGPITNEEYWDGRFHWLSVAPFDRHGCRVLCYDGAPRSPRD